MAWTLTVAGHDDELPGVWKECVWLGRVSKMRGKSVRVSEERSVVRSCVRIEKGHVGVLSHRRDDRHDLLSDLPKGELNCDRLDVTSR